MIYSTITSNLKKAFFLFLITFFVNSIVSSSEKNVDSFDLLSIDNRNTSIIDEKVEGSLLNDNPKIALIKVGTYDGYDADGNCISEPGQEILYTFSVKNTGNVTLSNIMVTDPLVTVSGGPITLAPGEEDTTTFTALYLITQNDIDSGNVENQAEAEACYEVDTEGNCDGQVNYLKLKYLGTILDANIEVVEHDGQTVFQGIVQPGEEFEFFGQDPPQITFGPKIDIFINNSLNQSIHTSCSIPIGIGSIFGDFEVIDGSSRNGGPFIPVIVDICDVEDLSDDYSYLEDDPTVVYICKNTIIALIKTGTFNDENQNGCADVGETINYIFSVKNTGLALLTNVIVTDPLLPVIGGPIDLAVDEENTTNFTGIYTITQDDIDAEEFINQAEATATLPTGDDITDLSDDDSYFENNPTVVYLCQNEKIALIKTGTFNDENQDDCADVGETITYTFSVKNTGLVDLTNVIVTDPLLPVIGGPIDLAVDEENTTNFIGIYTITQNDIDVEEFENQAEAIGTTPTGDDVTDLSDDDSYLENDPTVVYFCQNEKIALIKVGTYDGYDIDGNCISAPGQEILYTFSVKNTGNVTLSNIIVTDPLVTVSGGPITLAPGEEDTTTFTALYLFTQNNINTGYVENQAEVEACYEEEVSDGNCDGHVNYLKLKYLGNIPDANIEVIEHDGQTVYQGIVQPGEEFEFFGQDPPQITFGPKINIFINNSFNQLIHTSCSIPIGIGSVFGDFVVIDGSSRNGGPFISVIVDICDEVFDLSDDDSYLEDDPTVVYICQNTTIALIKTGSWIDENQNGCADVGETISYAFTVVNTGGVPLTNIMITDPLPGLILVGGPIAILELGEEDTTTFSATYSITQEDIVAEVVINQATVDGTSPVGEIVFDLSDDNSVLENDPTEIVLPSSDCLGVNDTLAQNMVMYPNPTSNSLNINLIDLNENFGYSIVNMLGQVVKIGTLNNGINTITLGNLNTGLYFVKVQDNTTNESVVNKLIIE